MAAVDLAQDQVPIRATTLTQARYDRMAPFYGAMESFMERAVFGELRRTLWSRVNAGRLLEVGVGTGMNIPHYPRLAQVTAIDLSERMLDRARQRAGALGMELDFRQMDAQELKFPENAFDAAVATFVFCSVPAPVLGLHEMGRVVKPGGDIWLMEHVRVNRPVVGPLMDMLNPLVVRVMGANINRQTVQNVRLAGLEVVDVEPLRGELVKLIHARPAWKA